MPEILRNQFVVNEPTDWQTGKPTGNPVFNQTPADPEDTLPLPSSLTPDAEAQTPEERDAENQQRLGLPEVPETNAAQPCHRQPSGYPRGMVPPIHEDNSPRFSRDNLPPDRPEASWSQTIPAVSSSAANQPVDPSDILPPRPPQ